MNLFFALTYVQNITMSNRSASEQVRITIKEIETLTYTCSNTDDLIQLNKQLQSVKADFIAKLPQQEGLLIRPAIQSLALRTKKKYAQFRARSHKQYSALPKPKSRGRKQADSRYRNRVGIQADRLRKVCCNHSVLNLLTRQTLMSKGGPIL